MTFCFNGQTLLRLASHFYPIYTGLGIFCSWLYSSVRRGKPNKTLLSVGCLMLSNPIVSYTLKYLIRQPRPYSSGHGMPSSHAFWAAGLGASLFLAMRSQHNRGLSVMPGSTVLKASAYVTCFTAPLVAIERVFSKEHTITQITIGLLLGIIYTFLAWAPAAYLADAIVRILSSFTFYTNGSGRADKNEFSLRSSDSDARRL